MLAKLLLCGLSLAGQTSSSQFPTMAAVARQTFYTDEPTGEVLVDLGEAASGRVRLTLSGREIVDEDVTGPGVARAPFPMGELPLGKNELECMERIRGQSPRSFQVEVVHLPPKPNEVKVDRLTGAFITDGLPLFPFGFYCYSPVQPTLPEEECVRGFSMMSPYQDINDASLNDRKQYMDRCASLGMKVNYNLVSLSGGGSGANLSPADREKRRLLIKEINEFKDHPALLAWYLSDEPDGENVSPASLEEQYKIVRQLDPYHPVTMVFNTPPKAPLYKNALDVAMTDPYPIPNRNPNQAGETITVLRKAFGLDKPLWIVPQAFGGGEWWSREPTRQEVRLMTWQSILNGASGVQYFVRHGLGAFPKSSDMWAECGRMAEEVFELSPFLQSPDKAPTPTCDVPNIQARCWQANGSVLLAIVNKANVPTPVHLKIQTKATEARLPFENRIVRVAQGSIDDFVDGYGTRFYILDEVGGWRKDATNPMVDSGFEENPSVGVPSGCYFNLGSDRGATARVDPRVFHTGKHSVRIVAPSDGGGLTLAFFPVSLVPGRSYRFVVWAKAARGTTPKLELGADVPDVAALGSRSVDLTGDWARYEAPFTIAAGASRVRVVPRIRLATKGTAWIDDIAILPEAKE